MRRILKNDNIGQWNPKKKCDKTLADTGRGALVPPSSQEGG